MNENRDMHPVMKKYFRSLYGEVKHKYILPYRSEADFYIPTIPMVVECKLKCSPKYIGAAIGEALMYRSLLKQIGVKEPIKIGLCFCDFPSPYKTWFEWGPDQARLLKDIADNIGEEIKLFLVRERDEAMYVEEVW